MRKSPPPGQRAATTTKLWLTLLALIHLIDRVTGRRHRRATHA